MNYKAIRLDEVLSMFSKDTFKRNKNSRHNKLNPYKWYDYLDTKKIENKEVISAERDI